MTEVHHAAGFASVRPSPLVPHDDYDEALRGLDAAFGRVHAIMHKLKGSRQPSREKVSTCIVDTSVDTEPARL